jgi:hypothetical protein
VVADPSAPRLHLRCPIAHAPAVASATLTRLNTAGDRRGMERF